LGELNSVQGMDSTLVFGIALRFWDRSDFSVSRRRGKAIKIARIFTRAILHSVDPAV
jgi:hypothetical protein